VFSSDGEDVSQAAYTGFNRTDYRQLLSATVERKNKNT
jgi:hypothetical protein